MEDRGHAAGKLGAALFVALQLSSPSLGAEDASAAPAPPAVADLNGTVAALLVFQGELVAAGDFTATLDSPVNYLARWQGTGWVPLGPEPDGPVAALAILGTDLIVGGSFQHVGDVAAAHIARWDGNAWAALGAGTDGPVRALAAHLGVILYVGGNFTTAGGQPAASVAQYLVGNWSALGGGLPGDVRALVVYNGAPVAGGDFPIAGATTHERNIARFTGNQWHPLAQGIDGTVSALTVLNGALIIGGSFEKADFVTPARHVASYLGGTWSAIGVGFGPIDSLDTGEVRSLQSQGSNLIAGGTFLLADLQSAPHVARWDGAGWSAIGTGTNAPVLALAVQGDDVVAGGEFTEAGGVAVGHIAYYRDRDWLPIRTVAVTVQDFRGMTTDAGITLCWSIAPADVASIARVDVERAPSAAGPWSPRTMTSLTPARQMSWIDPAASNPATGMWFYRLVLETSDGAVSVAGPIVVRSTRSERTRLNPPYVTKSGDAVVIPFALATAGTVRIEVFDVRGRLQRALETGQHPAGEHVWTWNRTDASGARVARGVYAVRLETGETRLVRKLVLMRP